MPGLGLTCVLLCLPPCQSDGDPKERVALDRVRESLSRLNRFHLDEDGRLRINRAAWAEEPDENGELKDDEPPPNFGGRMAGTTRRSIEKVLGRLKAATGTWTRSTSNSSKRSSSQFEGKQLRGSYVVSEDELDLHLQELQGKNRTLQLLDSQNTTRFLFYSPAGCIQVLRSPQGVHVASIIEGEVQSFVGDSFVDVVRKNTAYFHNKLQPALKGIALLPIEEALSVDAPDVKASSFGKEDAPGLLRSTVVVDAMLPLVQFRSVERQLVFNRVYGEKGAVDEQVKRVGSAMQALVDEAVQELKRRGATGMQIGDFKQKLRVGPRSVDERLSNPAVNSFRDLQYAMKAGPSSSSWGGDRFDLSFKRDSPPVKGRIVCAKAFESLEVSDAAEQVAVAITPESSKISVRTAVGLVSVSQTIKPAECVLLVIDPLGSKMFRGTTFVSMVQNVPPTIWKQTLDQFGRYGIGGLDLFQPAIVEEIAERLKSELPDRFEPDEAKTGIETMVFPLLNDAQYLQVVLKKLPADVQKPLRTRIIRLRRGL